MKVLILVDIQNDFLPGGALAVPNGDVVVSVANRLQARFELVIATQDWHPRDHSSFAANHSGRQPGDKIDLDGLPQVLWPVHCVQETFGAAFAPDLDLRRVQQVFQKGTDRRIDSYSGFFDNGRRKATGMEDYLRARKASTIHIVGLATDYCIKFTALDARRLGFETTVLVDGCRGVDLHPGDVEAAMAELKHAGVSLGTSSDFLLDE